MKKYIFRIVLVAIFISTIISCQKNNDTTPSTGGLDRDKFIGTWHVTSHHTPSGQTLNWDMTIVAGSSNSEMYLDNFDQMGTTNHVSATISGSSFTVPQQTVGSTAYKGSGSYSGGTLSFNYTDDDGVQPDTASATAHK